jgi:hypothetical protein
MSAKPAKDPRRNVDENALRLAALQIELRKGLSVSDAVAAVNAQFKDRVRCRMCGALCDEQRFCLNCQRWR